MNKLEERILKFLLTSSVYSENAIMMNFGINYEELINVFQILENEGYLEAYSTYLEREKLNEAACCKTKKESSCHSCKSTCSSCVNDCCSSNPFSQIEDLSKIKILTEKALNKFNY